MPIVVEGPPGSFLVSKRDECKSSVLPGLPILRQPDTHNGPTIPENLLEILLGAAERETADVHCVFLDETQSVLDGVNVEIRLL